MSQQTTNIDVNLIIAQIMPIINLVIVIVLIKTIIKEFKGVM